MNREQLKAVGVIVNSLLAWWDVADTEGVADEQDRLKALEAVAVVLGSPRTFPPPQPTATGLWRQFQKLPDLNQVPLAVIEGWTQDEREAAEAWGWEWDTWTGDVARGPLSEPPDVLKPYVRGAR